MNGFLPNLALNNNKVNRIFNPADFNYENEPVTQGDLLNDANKQGYNNFTELNNFTVIEFNENLNDVSPQIFSYLINVSVVCNHEIPKHILTSIEAHINGLFFSNYMTLEAHKKNEKLKKEQKKLQQ
jgi:hypothetical protein